MPLLSGKILFKGLQALHYVGYYQCKNVMVISTLSGLSQLHLFRGFYSSPHNAVLSGLK